MQNRFFLWLYNSTKPVELDLRNLPSDLPGTDDRYYIRILRHLDGLMGEEGLKFVVTWHLDAFHEAMEDAVVLLIGDEMHQFPSYQHKVRAIFKTSGFHRDPLGATVRLPGSIAWRTFLRDARDAAARTRRWWQLGSPRSMRHAGIPMYEIPLGYYRLRDINPLPFDERPLDAFFLGASATSSHRGFLRASAKARKQLTAVLAEVKAGHPQRRIEWMLVTPGGAGIPPEVYSQKMASTKIALCPRGNHGGETSRHFEAAKLGCAIISEPLPPRWYFEGFPGVIVRKWSELPGVISNLLNEPARLKDLSVRTQQWYDTEISEPVMAEFIAQRVRGTIRCR